MIEPPAPAHDPLLYGHELLAESVDGFASVDDAALKRYEDRGYLLVRGGLSEAEVRAAKRTLHRMTTADEPGANAVYFGGAIREHLLSEPAEERTIGAEGASGALALGRSGDALPDLPGEVRARYVRKFGGFVDHQPALRAIAEQPAMLDLVERLARGPVRLFQNMAMIKPPGGREKPWHQDHAYFDFALETRIVGVWIAVDRVDTGNGCMHLLAGAHKEGPRTHFMRRDWQICDTELAGCTRTAAVMDPGDVLLFDAKLPHGTPTNQSDQFRWSLQFHYLPESAEATDPQVRLGAFGNEGKNVTC